MKKIINRINDNCFLLYTCFFILLLSVIVVLFVSNGISFMYSGDALHQHFITLNYFRSLLKNLIINHTITTFTWNIGFGLDMFANLSYYIFGDFISYFSIFFKKTHLELFYYIALFMRMYLIGISFCYYSKYHKNSNISTVIGALIYTFSGLVLFQIVHPYFLNALVIYPILMISTDKFLLEEKKESFPFAVAIAIISNFYFAFFNILFIIIYGSILIFLYSKGKEILKKYISIIIYGIIGILISLIISGPTIYAFFDSTRLSDFEITSYHIVYYKNLLKTMIDIVPDSYNTLIGVSSLILVALPIVFINIRNKKYIPFILMTLIAALPLISFKIATIFCAMSFPKNRWTYILIFILSYTITIFINDLKNHKLKDYKITSILILLYVIISFLIFDNDISSRLALSLFLVPLFLYFCYKNKPIYIITIVIVNLVFNIYYLYSSDGYNFINYFIDYNSYSQYYEDFEVKDINQIVKSITKNDKSYYNILENRNHYKNSGLYYDYNTISYYYSLVSNKYANLSKDLGNSEYQINKEISNLDFRTKINTLLSTKYFISNNTLPPPYGYNVISKTNTSSTYKNNYTTDFAKFYDSYITISQYDNLTPLQKENILLKTAVLDKNYNLKNNIDAIEIAKKEIEEIDYKILSKNISKDNIVITNNKLKLQIPEIKEKEIFILIKGFDYNPLSKEELIENTLKGNYKKRDLVNANKKYKWYYKKYSFDLTVKFGNISKKIAVNDKMHSEYYYDYNDYLLINLGYFDKASGAIEISLNSTGTYTFDSLQILTNSFQNYSKDIDNLNRINIKNLSINNNITSFDYDIEKDGILQFNTIYSKGWKIYIDNELVPSITSNKYFLGTYSKSGNHSIKLVYETPYFRCCSYISIFTLVSYTSFILIKKKKDKNGS